MQSRWRIKSANNNLFDDPYFLVFSVCFLLITCNFQRRMTSSATSKKTGFLTPRVMKVLSLAGAFLVGAAVVFLIYQVTGGGGSRTAHGGPPPVVEEEKPAGPDKRRLIKDMLLPRDVKPSSYNLKLKAYLPGYGASIPKDKELSFDAAVVVHLKAESEVSEVVLNSAELTFKKEHCFAETTVRYPLLQ